MELGKKTEAELRAMIMEIEAKLKAREPQTTARYAIRWGDYNKRRYSRPWIAKITAWPVGGKPTLDFGEYCGDTSGGETEIMAREGDIIRSGQRDYRGNSTINDWYLAKADGELELIDAAQGRKLYR